MKKGTYTTKSDEGVDDDKRGKNKVKQPGFNHILQDKQRTRLMMGQKPYEQRNIPGGWRYEHMMQQQEQQRQQDNTCNSIGKQVEERLRLVDLQCHSDNLLGKASKAWKLPGCNNVAAMSSTSSTTYPMTATATKMGKSTKTSTHLNSANQSNSDLNSIGPSYTSACSSGTHWNTFNDPHPGPHPTFEISQGETNSGTNGGEDSVQRTKLQYLACGSSAFSASLVSSSTSSKRKRQPHHDGTYAEYPTRRPDCSSSVSTKASQSTATQIDTCNDSTYTGSTITSTPSFRTDLEQSQKQGPMVLNLQSSLGSLNPNAPTAIPYTGSSMTSRSYRVEGHRQQHQYKGQGGPTMEHVQSSLSQLKTHDDDDSTMKSWMVSSTEQQRTRMGLTPIVSRIHSTDATVRCSGGGTRENSKSTSVTSGAHVVDCNFSTFGIAVSSNKGNCPILQPNKIDGIPKALLYTLYGQTYRKQVSPEDYQIWDNRGKPHELKFTAIFICPVTREPFPCGRYGDEQYYTVAEGKVWYSKKVLALHGAASRAFDCLSFRRAVQTSASCYDSIGKEKPYLTHDAPQMPPSYLPADKKIYIQQNNSPERGRTDDGNTTPTTSNSTLQSMGNGNINLYHTPSYN